MNFEILHNGNTYKPFYIEQDVGNGMLGPKEDMLDSICSSGFASCIATVLRDSEGNFVSLSHNSKVENLNSYKILVRSEKRKLSKKIKKPSKTKIPPNTQFKLDVGFCFHEFCVGVADEFFREKNMRIDVFNGDYTKIDAIEDHYRQQFRDQFNDSKNADAEKFFTNKFKMLKDIENYFDLKITNLPKSTILVKKNEGGKPSEIVTDIDERHMNNVFFSFSQNLKPVNSYSSPPFCFPPLPITSESPPFGIPPLPGTSPESSPKRPKFDHSVINAQSIQDSKPVLSGLDTIEKIIGEDLKVDQFFTQNKQPKPGNEVSSATASTINKKAIEELKFQS